MSQWRKSSYTSAGDPQCVELACPGADWRAVRDSKQPDGPTLAFPVRSFAAFLSNTKNSL